MREFKFDIDDWTGGNTLGKSMGDAVGKAVEPYDIQITTHPIDVFILRLIDGYDFTIQWDRDEKPIEYKGVGTIVIHDYEDGFKEREITIHITNLDDCINDFEYFEYFASPILIYFSDKSNTSYKIASIIINNKDREELLQLINFYNPYTSSLTLDLTELSDPIDISITGKNLKTIGEAALSRLYINNIILPDTITHIKRDAFLGTVFKNGFTVPKKVEHIDNSAFKLCNFNNKLVLSDKIKFIGIDAFTYSKNIKNLLIPDSINKLGKFAFARTDISNNINIPKYLTHIESGVFRDCVSIAGTLTIPRTVKSIQDLAFFRCLNLTGSLTIPSTVEYIGDNAFDTCTKLEHIVFEEGVKRIGKDAFYNCCSLKNDIILPESLIELGDNAFLFCNNIKTLYVCETTKTDFTYAMFNIVTYKKGEKPKIN